MSITPDTGFLTKQEISDKYGRSVRRVTSDFTSMLRTRDDGVAHLRLYLDDGTKVRHLAGSDVTLEQVNQWNQEGKKLLWTAEAEWANTRWGSETKATTSTKQAEPAQQPNPDSISPPVEERNAEASTQGEQGEIIHLLKKSIEDKDEEIAFLREDLKVKNEQITAAQKLWGQSNELTKDLHEFMKGMDERLTGKSSPGTQQVAAPKSNATSTANDAQVVDATPAPNTPTKQTKQKASTKTKRKQASKKSSKAKQVRSGPKKKAAPKPPQTIWNTPVNELASRLLRR